MNYATNFAIVKNGTVTNLLRGLVYNTMDDFPNAVHTDNLDVQIGDTYENGVFMRDGQVVTGGNVGVQSDWNQNDDTQPDYVKNRPFYTGDPVETVLVEESTVTIRNNQAELETTFAATIGETYKISWDGAAYECTCVASGDKIYIGNLSIIGAGSDTGEPFLMMVFNGNGIYVLTTEASASHTFSISSIQPQIVKIPWEFIDKDASGYIVVHKNSTMTEQEAQNYMTAIAAREMLLIEWYNLYIENISVGNNYIDITTINGEEYRIEKNGDGVFKLFDRKIIRALFPYKASSAENFPKILVDYNKVEIENSNPAFVSTHTLFSVKKIGEQSKAFEVRGNGDAVAQAIILYSSTADSVKQFKITVDDSGTISATEVS